jgi:hypothetical protein
MHALLRIAAAAVSWASIAIVAQTPARNSAQPPSSAPPVRSTSAPSRSATLSIAGQPEQAPLIHVNGRSYVDIESLARLTHADVRYVGSQIVLTLPGESQTPAGPRTPQLSSAFLAAEIEALTAIREWRVTLVYAVQNNTPLSENWLGPLRRFAEAKLQLAAAAASTAPDQSTLELLRNEFANMQQESNTFLDMRARVNYISPDSFDNNAQDQKILTCERALAQVAASKQFQDDPSCH